MSQRRAIAREKKSQTNQGMIGGGGKSMAPPAFQLKTPEGQADPGGKKDHSALIHPRSKRGTKAQEALSYVSPELQAYNGIYQMHQVFVEQLEWHNKNLKAYKSLMGNPKFLNEKQLEAYYEKVNKTEKARQFLQQKVDAQEAILRSRLPSIPEYSAYQLNEHLRSRAAELESQVGLKMPGDKEETDPVKAQKLGVLRTELAQIQADMLAVESNRRDPSKLLALRHKYQLPTEDRKTETDLGKNMGASNGGLSSQKGSRRVEKIGEHLETEDQITTKALNGNGFSKTKTDSFQINGASGSFNQKTDEKTELNWFERSLTRSKTTTTGMETADGKKDSVANQDFKKADASGYTWGSGETKTDNQLPSQDQFKSEKTSNKIERGGGKLGYRRSSSNQKGTLGPDGQMGAGMDSNWNAGGGALLGPDGVGVYGDAEKGFKHKREDGSSVGARATFGGKMLVSVKDIGGNPKQYAIVIHISSEAGAFANYGQEGSAGSVGGEGGLKVANSYSIRKILSESEKDAYLKSVDMAEAGKTTPTHPELGVVAAIGKNSGKVSQAMIDQFKSDKGLAERAREMKSGEGMDLSNDKSAELGGSAGNGTLGVNLKYHGGRKKDTNLLVVGDNVILTVSINSRSGYNAGATVGMPLIKGGASFGSEESTGKIIRVTIPKDDPLLEKIAGELQAAEHEHQLLAVKAKYPQVNIISGNAKGSKESEAASMEIPFVGLGFNASGEYNQKEFSDGSAAYHGGNGVGGNISVLGAKMGSNSKEELDAEVDAKGNVEIDLKETNSEFDLSKTVDQLGKNLKHDPIGLLTGGAKTIQESSDATGTFMSNKDVDYLIHLAHSKGYDNYINSPVLRAEWASCVQKIRIAGKDRKAASKALAEFMGKKRHGKKEAIESMLESAGHRNGGNRWEFPEGTAGLKSEYKWLLKGAPVNQIQGLLRQQKTADALQMTKDVLARITKVRGGLQAAEAKFEDKSRLADMLTFLANLKTQVLAVQYQMQNPKAKPAEVLHKADKTRFDEALSRCQTYKGQETRFYAQIVDMMKDGHVSHSETIERAEILKQLDDVYLRWDDDHALLNHLHGEHGFGGPGFNLDDLSPNRQKLELSREGNAPLVAEAGMASAVNKAVQASVRRMENEEAKKRQAEAAKARKARKAKAQALIAQIRGQQASISKAMGLCNGMNLRKETGLIKAGARSNWGKGFNANAKAQKALQQLQAIAVNGSMAEIEKAGQYALGLCLESVNAFEKGNQIQKYGG